MSVRSWHSLTRSAEPRSLSPLIALGIVLISACAPQTPGSETPAGTPTGGAAVTDDLSSQNLAAGQQTFRFETFGNEQFWADTARMHEVVQKSVSPTTALSVGLKVDADAIPPD